MIADAISNALTSKKSKPTLPTVDAYTAPARRAFTESAKGYDVATEATKGARAALARLTNLIDARATALDGLDVELGPVSEQLERDDHAMALADEVKGEPDIKPPPRLTKAARDRLVTKQGELQADRVRAVLSLETLELAHSEAATTFDTARRTEAERLATMRRALCSLVVAHAQHAMASGGLTRAHARALLNACALGRGAILPGAERLYAHAIRLTAPPTAVVVPGATAIDPALAATGISRESALDWCGACVEAARKGEAVDVIGGPVVDLKWLDDVSCDDPVIGAGDDEWPGVASSVAPFAERLESRDRTGQHRTFVPRGTVGAVAGTSLRFAGLGE